MGKSSHDITPVTREHRIQLAQNYALANGEKSDVIPREQERIIPKFLSISQLFSFYVKPPPKTHIYTTTIGDNILVEIPQPSVEIPQPSVEIPTYNTSTKRSLN